MTHLKPKIIDEPAKTSVLEDMEPDPRSRIILPPVIMKTLFRLAPSSEQVLQDPDPEPPAQGSSLGMSFRRWVKFPFSWLYHKTFGYPPIRNVEVLSKFLPIFYRISDEFRHDALPYVKSHAIYLNDDDDQEVLVAEADLKHCRDSKHWFVRNRSRLIEKKRLTVVRYSEQIISELDEISETQFGRFLRHKWDSGKLKAFEEIQYQKRVRGE